MFDMPKTRKLIELQGYLHLDDETICGIQYGLRVAPAICAVWAATGTVLVSPGVLLSLAPFALLGAVFPGHPFDIFYRWWLRKPLNGAPLPPSPFPRRFACFTAMCFLIAAGTAMLLGRPVIGIVLGAWLSLAAATNVFTGLCLPSLVLHRLSKAVARLSPMRR